MDVWGKRQTQDKRERETLGKEGGTRKRRGGRTDAQLSVKPKMYMNAVALTNKSLRVSYPYYTLLLE